MSEEVSELVENNNKRYKPSILDLFKNITSENEKQQTKNQLTLLKHFKIKDCTPEDIKYTLNRFVKGLGAQNSKSKIGFYTVLVAFIKTVNISAADVLDAINKELQLSSKNTRSENADISSGQILAVGAVIRSGLIQNESSDKKKELVRILITAGHKRDYLLSSAYSFIVELLDKFTNKDFKAIVVPILQEHNKEVSCLDSLYLMLVLHKVIPKVQVFDDSAIQDGNLKDFCRILMNPPKLSFQNHPVYKVFLDWLITRDVQSISDFAVELDTYLQHGKTSFNKLSLALAILTHLAEMITDSAVIPDILQNNLLQQILTHCNQTRGSPKDVLKQSIHLFLDKIAQNLARDTCKQKHKIATLKKFWFNPGSMDFERIVANKVIQQIIAGLHLESVKKLSDLLMQIIKDEISTERKHINNNSRVYAAQLLVKLMSHPKANEDISWKAEKLILLADVSLFTYPDISNELADSLRGVFFRALDIKLPKLADLRNVLSLLVHHINNKLYKDMEQPRVVIDKTRGEIWTETLKRIDEFEKHKSQQPLIQVFHTLFLNIILQIYREESIAESSLQELFSCYERASGKKSSQDDVHWIQVVVDLFLNLLSQNTHLLRSLVRCVFPHLCPHLNRDAIHQILAVFEPSNDIETLLGEDGDSADEDDFEESKDNDSNDNEEIDESSDSDDDDDFNTDDDAQETVNDRLRDALSTVLRHQGAVQSDVESVDIDDMDDEEASKLDAALANAFKQFRPNTGKKSKKQSKEEQTLTHFRVRVLDLIEMYIDTAPPMQLVLEVMLPLLQCLEFSIRDVHQLPLLRRITHCLKKLGSLKKFSNTEGVTQQVLHDLLFSLLEKGSKSALMMQDMSNQLTECCVFVLRCSNMLVTIGEGKAQTKNSILKDLVVKELQKFLLQRDCLTPQQFFKNILGMVWSGNILLANELLERAFDDQVRPFKRSQALDMLRIFYLNNRFISGCTDIEKLKLKELEQNIVHKITEILTNDEGAKLKDKFVTNLFNLLQAVRKSPLESEMTIWKSLGEIIREYRSGVTLSKDSKASYNKLCNCLGINQAVEMKKSTVTLEAEQETEKVAQGDKPKVKAKGHHKERKEKKAARLLRMQSLSEGLEELMLFSTSDRNDHEGRNDAEMESEVKAKQSKKRRKSENVNKSEIPKINGSTKKKKTK